MNYRYYPTPESIVDSVFRTHMPRKIERVLEPSVGEGSLLKCLAMLKDNFQLTAIDVDVNKINYCKGRFDTFSDVHWVNDNFMNFQSSIQYDLVISNPPFDGRTLLEYKNNKVPIEAIFLDKCLDLIEPNGRIISILPASIIDGAKLAWLRKKFVDNFDITYSYKLDQFCFPNVEADFHIVVAVKKNTRKQQTIMRKSEFQKSVNLRELLPILDSLDFDKIDGHFMEKDLFSALDFETVTVDELFLVKRGRVTHDYNSPRCIHTNDLNKGEWTEPNAICNIANETNIARKGDLLMKRVSRNLLYSLIKYEGRDALITDCIYNLRLRDKCGKKIVDKFLFAYYCLCESGLLRKNLLKGTGAKYLQISKLRSLKIPINLCDHFVVDYKEFKELDNQRDKLKVCSRVAHKVTLLVSTKDSENIILFDSKRPSSSNTGGSDNCELLIRK
jgi:tRNA1(Val) A37 N6-methylase TrmN6